MKHKGKPAYWGHNTVRQAERRFLREKKTQSERVNDARKATADVFVMCILSAIYDKYGIGETRLQRVADAANERAERYQQTKEGLPRLVDGKKKTGPELAELDLTADTAAYFPADFILPIHKLPKKRDVAMAYEQRAAAATVAKLYAYGMNKALGFGAERVACVMQEAVGNYQQFREWADSGDYYGYELLARKMGQIMHSPCSVDTAGADTPVFGDTLD